MMACYKAQLVNSLANRSRSVQHWLKIKIRRALMNTPHPKLRSLFSSLTMISLLATPRIHLSVNKVNERAYGYASRPLCPVRLGLVGPGRSCYIQVSPRNIIRELFKKSGSRNRSAFPTAHVLDVGYVGFDLLGVLLVQR